MKNDKRLFCQYEKLICGGSTSSSAFILPLFWQPFCSLFLLFPLSFATFLPSLLTFTSPPSSLLSRPLIRSTATIIIAAETYNTVLTAHAAAKIMHMLTHIFQGQPGLTHSASVNSLDMIVCINIFNIQ